LYGDDTGGSFVQVEDDDFDAGIFDCRRRLLVIDDVGDEGGVELAVISDKSRLGVGGTIFDVRFVGGFLVLVGNLADFLRVGETSFDEFFVVALRLV